MMEEGGNTEKSKEEDNAKDYIKKQLEDEDDQDGPPIPPDGRYGWVIVIASFLTNVVVDGVCFSVGIFMIEFLEHFQVSKATMSWVGSVLNGMYLSVGPIVGALANKFGCRPVAIAGGIFAAVSYVLASFSPNVEVLILTYGAMGGFGFGLLYLPAIVMVGYYFEKRRAFATGIAVCGSGIGAFVFAPLCHYLLDVYSWKGASWILGGIALQGVVIGALFRPLTNPKSKTKSNMVERIKFENERQLIQCEAQPEKLHNKVKLLQNEGKNDVSCIHSMQNLSPSGVGSLKKDDVNWTKSVDDLLLLKNKPVKKVVDLSNPLYRKDIFYSGSIQNLPEYKQSPDLKTYVKTVTKVPSETKSNYDETKGTCARILNAIGNQLSSFALLKNPVFLIYGISCFLCMTGFFVPFIFLPDHAIEMNLTGQQGAFLISIIGIANTIARVLCGFISDLPWVDCILINNVALLVAGISTMLCPFCFNYGLLAAYSVVFGSGIAVFVSLRSIVVVELLGLENLTNAFGLVTMFQGLSAFIGAPIAGALYDATGNYDYSFYMAGATLAMAGAINLPLRRLAAYLKKRDLKQNGIISDGTECIVVNGVQ